MSSAAVGIFTKPEELLAQFELEAIEGYIRHAVVINVAFAFSCYLAYPTTLRYKPPLRPDGTPDTVARVDVIYQSENNIQNGRRDRVPVLVRVESYSFWESRFANEREPNPPEPTAESLRHSQKTPRPVSLIFSNCFTYDHNRQCFTDHRNQPLSGNDVINWAFRQHCRTTHAIWGLPIRWQMQLSEWLYRCLEQSIRVLEWIMRCLLGRTFDAADRAWMAMKPIPYSAYHIVPGNELTAQWAGYRTTVNVMVSLCVLIVLGGLAAYALRHDIPALAVFAKQPIYSSAVLLLVLFTLDRLLPRGVAGAINAAIRMKLRIFEFRQKLMVK